MISSISKHIAFTKHELATHASLPLLAGVLWLIPGLTNTDRPAIYTDDFVGVEVWDMWYYFPVLIAVVVATAALTSRQKLRMQLIALFVAASLVGQAIGIQVFLIVEGATFDSVFALLLGPVIFMFFYSLIVMPFGLTLFMLSRLVMKLILNRAVF